ncbi:unnamed protein product, partial [Polarella glacialis]
MQAVPALSTKQPHNQTTTQPNNQTTTVVSKQQTTAPRPRIEHDVELQVLNSRLDEAFRRLEQAEAASTSQDARFLELLGRCGGEGSWESLASRNELAAVERRLTVGWQQEAAEFTTELEELRRTTAEDSAVTALGSQLSQRLDGVASDLAAAQEGLQRLASEHYSFVSEAYANLATKAEQQSACSLLQAGVDSLATELAAAVVELQELKGFTSRQDAGLDLARGRLDELELGSKAAASCIDRIKEDASSLQQFCNEELATRIFTEKVAEGVKDVQEKLDLAVIDRATIHRRLEREGEVTRRAFALQQNTFQDVENVAESLKVVSASSAAMQGRCAEQEKAMQEMTSHQEEDREALKRALQEMRTDHNHLEDLCNSLQLEFQEQADHFRETAERLGTCSTRISLEQMDQTLGLRQSMDELSQGHAKLASTLHGSDKVQAVRGEDGWTVL